MAERTRFLTLVFEDAPKGAPIRLFAETEYGTCILADVRNLASELEQERAAVAYALAHDDLNWLSEWADGNPEQKGELAAWLESGRRDPAQAKEDADG
jgi:hypothetical protein